MKKIKDNHSSEPGVNEVVEDIEALKRTRLSAKEQQLLLTIAETVHHTLENRRDAEKTTQNLKILEVLAVQVSKRNPTYFKLGVSLLVLAATIAFGLGLVMALPSFGLSLAVVSAGFLGLSSVSAVTACLGLFSLSRSIDPKRTQLGNNLDDLVTKIKISSGPHSP